MSTILYEAQRISYFYKAQLQKFADIPGTVERNLAQSRASGLNKIIFIQS